MNKKEFQKAIERRTGHTIEEIRNMSLEDMRKLHETEYGEPMQVIGTGLLRILSRQEIEKEVDKLYDNF
jgi:hypothetical protein